LAISPASLIANNLIHTIPKAFTTHYIRWQVVKCSTN